MVRLRQARYSCLPAYQRSTCRRTGSEIADALRRDCTLRYDRDDTQAVEDVSFITAPWIFCYFPRPYGVRQERTHQTTLMMIITTRSATLSDSPGRTY